jgi:hypothetical protein
MMTLTISQAPSSMSAPRDNTRLRESPNTMVNTPNPKTHASIVRPALRAIGLFATRIAMAMAPHPGAARRIPRPAVPACRISLA